MSFKISAAAAALLLLPAAQGFAATIVIDEFTTDQLVVDVPGAGQVNNSQVADGSAIGGYRDMQVTNYGNNNQATELRVTEGTLGFSNIALNSGEGLITYDGNDDPTSLDTTGLGGANILAGTVENSAFIFDVVEFDANLFIRVSLWDMDGTSIFYEETLPEAAAFSPVLAFTDFDGYEDFDFTSVGAIQFFVQSTTDNLDGALRSVRVEGEPEVIPLPASALLLLGGLGGLGALRARRRNA